MNSYLFSGERIRVAGTGCWRQPLSVVNVGARAAGLHGAIYQPPELDLKFDGLLFVLGWLAVAMNLAVAHFGIGLEAGCGIEQRMSECWRIAEAVDLASVDRLLADRDAHFRFGLSQGMAHRRSAPRLRAGRRR